MAVQHREGVLELEVVGLLLARLDAEPLQLAQKLGDQDVELAVVLSDPALPRRKCPAVASPCPHRVGVGARGGGPPPAGASVEVVAGSQRRRRERAGDQIRVAHDPIGNALVLHALVGHPLLACLVGAVGLDERLEPVEVVVGALAGVQPEEGSELAQGVPVPAGAAQQIPLPPALLPVDPGTEHQGVAGVLAGHRAGQPGVVATQVVQDVAGRIVALAPGL